MPIKKDATGKRWVEMELLVPGTPEQVWHAIATGAGYTAWFTSAEIEPRVGGSLRFDFGEGASSVGEVTQWQPPQAFGYVERDWSEGAPPVATEITITARSGGQCVLRMVHSLFSSTDDWDDEIEGFERGWPGFFVVLRAYLTHFVDRPASSFLAMTPAAGEALPSWQRLGEALGLAGASVGERRSSTSLPEPWSGVVEHVHQDAEQRFYVLRLDEPAPGLALLGISAKKGAPINISLCRYYFGDRADALAAEGAPRWRAWFAETFGQDAPSTRANISRS